MQGDVTRRIGVDGTIGIGAGSRTFRSPALDVGVNFGLVDRSARRLLLFERPLFLRAVDLAKVVNAPVLLRSRTRFQEVRNRDRSEEADDGHYDHDFDQREASVPFNPFNVHMVCERCEPSQLLVTISPESVHELQLASRTLGLLHIQACRVTPS